MLLYDLDVKGKTKCFNTLIVQPIFQYLVAIYAPQGHNFWWQL